MTDAPQDNSQLLRRLATAEMELAILQRAVAEAEQQYNDLFENASDSIFIIDLPTNVILATNKSAARRLGYTRDELIGMQLGSIEQPPSADSLNWVSNFGQTQYYETSFVAQDGRLIPFEVSSRVINLGGGKALQLTARNIEARRTAQKRELEDSLERHRMGLLTGFIQNAAHEFRTPLSIIATNAYLLHNTPDRDKRDLAYQRIQGEVTRMGTLLDMMLLQAALENSTEGPQAWMNVGSLVRSVCEEWKSRQPHGPTLIYATSEDLPQSMGNAGYVSAALYQLLANAYRFTPATGTIRVQAYERQNAIVIEVEDNGQGIAADDLPNIFSAFWRKDTAHTTPGLGLGLSIIQKIVQHHRGDIRAESAIGVGSRFTMRLPIIIPPDDGVPH